MIGRAIADSGRDKPFWVYECVRAVLGPEYGRAGDPDVSPVIAKLMKKEGE